MKKGQRLTLVGANVTGWKDGEAVFTLLQRMWHDAGVDLDIKNYLSSLMFASYGTGGILQTGKFDVELSIWSNGVDPDDATLFMCDQVPPAGENIFYRQSQACSADSG